MNLVTFLLLVLTFPYWFPVVALPALAIGLLWMIGYCTQGNNRADRTSRD